MHWKWAKLHRVEINRHCIFWFSSELLNLQPSFWTLPTFKLSKWKFFINKVLQILPTVMMFNEFILICTLTSTWRTLIWELITNFSNKKRPIEMNLHSTVMHERREWSMRDDSMTYGSRVPYQSFYPNAPAATKRGNNGTVLIVIRRDKIQKVLWDSIIVPCNSCSGEYVDAKLAQYKLAASNHRMKIWPSCNLISCTVLIVRLFPKPNQPNKAEQT